MADHLDDNERHAMIVEALLRPEYVEPYRRSAYSKMVVDQFAAMVPLMLKGLMDEALKQDDRARSFERLREAMRPQDPKDVFADLVDSPPYAWTEWVCPDCGWHTMSVEREQHSCPVPALRERMAPHMERLLHDLHSLNGEARSNAQVMIPTAWYPHGDTSLGLGTIFGGVKVVRGAVSGPVVLPGLPDPKGWKWPTQREETP